MLFRSEQVAEIMSTKLEKQKKSAERKFQAAKRSFQQKDVKENAPRTMKEHKKIKEIKKKQPNISTEDAYAMISSLAPTRLTLEVDIDKLLAQLQGYAILMSYHIQHRGAAPRFPQPYPNAWCPSQIYAYLITVTTAYLLRIGALSVSSQILTVGELFVPTFFAKWLQQFFGPIKHCGRKVVTLVPTSAEALYATNCGQGGLGSAGSNIPDGFRDAPCFVPVQNDSEGWYSVNYDGSYAVVTPFSQQGKVNSAISSVITRAFQHTVCAHDIPAKASSTELKITPVAEGFYGNFAYSCVDSKQMCDVLLPLAYPNAPTLINTPCPTQVGAPVRIDGGMCSSPESKVALMFYLANNQKFEAGDSFKTYLRKFGVKEEHMGNLQINLRQFNWLGFFNEVATYVNTITTLAPDGYWYLVNYLASVIMSNIPGCFRALSPIRRDWNIAPLYKNKTNEPNYSSYARQVKLPPFISQVLRALRKPIRYENQISFYVQCASFDGDPNWWSAMATNTNYKLGDWTSYGQIPSVPSQTGLANMSPGTPVTFSPYPGARIFGTPPWTGDAARNMVTCYGMPSWIPFFSQNLGLQSQSNAGQNLFTQWNTKVTACTKRMAKYYVVSKVDEYALKTVPAVLNIAVWNMFPLSARLICSQEPTSHRSTVLAMAHIMTYYSPSNLNIPVVAPTFSAEPIEASNTASASAMMSATPGQGTPGQILIAKASNPAEAEAAMAAEGVDGVVPNNSATLPKHIESKVGEKLKSAISTGVDDAASALGDFAGNMFNKII